MNFSRDSENKSFSLKDNVRIDDNVRAMPGDLKNNQYNSNSSSMKPSFSDDSRRSPTNELKPNFSNKLLEEDLMAFGNKNKMKNLSSSEESSSEDDSSSGSSVSTEDSGRGMGTAQSSDQLFGPPRGNDSDSEESDGRGGNFNPFAQMNQREDTLTSSSGASESSERRMPPIREKSLEEIAQEKGEMLRRLERLEESGFKPSKKFTMNSSYDEIKFEYERLKNSRDIDKSIKFQRKVLMAVTSGIEFLNGKFDPFDIKLDGWSESIYENMHEYDDVFEELHEKYKEKVKVAPELKLLMMVGGSAFMFHMTNTLFKSKMPGLGDILKQNPELAKNVQQAAMNSMRQNEERSGNPDPLFNMMMNQAQSMMGPPKPAQRSNPMGPGVKEMKGPSGVDDILKMVNNRPNVSNSKEDTVSSVSTQDSTERRRIKLKKPVSVQKNSNGKFVLDLQ